MKLVAPCWCIVLILAQITTSHAGTTKLADTNDNNNEAPSTSHSVPTNLEKAEAKYNAAVSSLNVVSSHSPSQSYPYMQQLPLTGSLSSTFLDLAENSNFWPVSRLISYIRYPQSQQHHQQSKTKQNILLQIFSLLKALINSLTDILPYLYNMTSPLGLPKLKSNFVLSQADSQIAMNGVVELLESSAALGYYKSYALLGELFLWGNYGLKPDPVKALENYETSSRLLGDPESQYMTGFINSAGDWLSSGNDTLESNQANALLYYTFSSLDGHSNAEMTLAYRYWAGISTPQSCQDALIIYKRLADHAIHYYNQGPPGGRHLPIPKTSISVRNGGIFGPGASVGPRSATIRSRYRPKFNEWSDFLEYYHTNAKHGDPSAMFRLGVSYYDGVHIPSSAVNTEDGVKRDFPKAMKWFSRLARNVWPRDPQLAMRPGGAYHADKDIKLKPDDNYLVLSGMTAGFIGRMYFRGEGVPQDFQKAALWFHRGASEEDRESHNALGIMYRDGLTVRKDLQKAVAHFQAAASANLPDAFVNLGKFHLSIRDRQRATNFFEQAIRHGDAFQSLYYLAQLQNDPNNEEDPEASCPVITSFYKTVAEHGDWGNRDWFEAEKAWHEGDIQRALLKYWLVAERGYEVAQDNVATILDRDKSWLKPAPDMNPIRDRLALMFWTRSAAQENIDSLVKMGDYYLKGLGLESSNPQPDKAAACYQSAANSHISALAMHNLGWMHENGIGVEKDFHLAKRYYDLSLETDSQAYLPSTISLVKLHLRSILSSITGSDIEGLTLFGSSNEKHDTQNDNNNKKNSNKVPSFSSSPIGFATKVFRDIWSSVNRIKNEAFKIWKDEANAISGSGSGDNLSPDSAKEHEMNARKNLHTTLESDGDLSEWARMNTKDRRFDDEDDDEHLVFDDDDDDLIETIIFIGLCLVFGWLIYYRQVRQEANRAGNNNNDNIRRDQPPTPTTPAPSTQAPTSTATSTSQSASLSDSTTHRRLDASSSADGS